MSMNVLLTCAGRSYALVQYFQEALSSRGVVIACDTTERSAGLTVAGGKAVVPPLESDRLFTAVSMPNPHLVTFVDAVDEAELVAVGELLIGVGLILGVFTGIAAFFGAFMNWNFMMAGTALGLTYNKLTSDLPPNGTIVQALREHSISFTSASFTVSGLEIPLNDEL